MAGSLFMQPFERSVWAPTNASQKPPAAPPFSHWIELLLGEGGGGRAEEKKKKKNVFGYLRRFSHYYKTKSTVGGLLIKPE